MRRPATTSLAIIAVMAAAVCLMTSHTSAQGPDMAALAQKFGVSAKANAAALRQYSWKMRVETTLKGNPRPVSIYTMRFDMDGKVQKTLMTAPAAAPEPARGLKGRIKEKKIAEAKEWAGDLAELVKGYLSPAPPVMQTFFGKAAVVATPDGFAQIYSEGLMQPGDKLVYEVDPKTASLRRVLFTTALEKDPVNGTVEFMQLSGGPNVAARTTVSVPAKQLTAKIENFDYVRQ